MGMNDAGPNHESITLFRQTVQQYYRQSGRHDLPWRQRAPSGGFDAYKIVVSELMLQQTQVARVIPKYTEFLIAFPSVAALAAAPLGRVLRVWSGLGYNRRAKFLHLAAQAIMTDHAGVFPPDPPSLMRLPGVGPNTAGAILVYAFNQPVIFIETNIRTVYLHHFYQATVGVADRDILKLVALTLDRDHTREWYWALMDYGSYLKRTFGNPNRAGQGYVRQSAFIGSDRAVRGQIIKRLAGASISRRELAAAVADERFETIVSALLAEGLIQQQGSQLSL